MRDVFAPNGGSLAKRMARYVIEGGGDVSSLFRDEKVREAFWSVPDPILSVYDHCELLKAAEQVSGDPDFGLSFAQKCDLREAGLIGYTMRSCTTLGAAFAALADASGLFVAEPCELAGSATSADPAIKAVSLTWSYGGHAKLDLRHWAEFTAAFLTTNFKALTRHPVHPLRVEFIHSAQGGGAASDAIFGVAPSFGCSRNRLIFSEEDTHTSLLSQDLQLLDILQDYAKLMHASDPADTNHLSITVERLIMDRLAEGEASLAKISELLGMSQRTLSRRLTAEDTSFFAILERVRKSLAIRYLSSREKSLSEIAFLLGYSSLSSFNDAFRRWTGDSPGSYRTQATTPR